jgi:hypothetical protein
MMSWWGDSHLLTGSMGAVVKPIEVLEAALRAAGCKKRGRESWTCPAHDDRHPSLSIREGEDRRALVFCHRGCNVESIVAALGLELADLFASDGC